MRLLSAVFALFLLSVAALGLTLRRAENPAASPALDPASSAPVLVELFTSEGCSSCPPADALLAKLDAEGRVHGAEVIVLEEHVDYWNHLGWKDPYSSSQWTSRQQDYAVAFHNGGIYTPQMVVDGADEFVGSRERQARQAIRAAAGKPKAEVRVESQELSPTRFQVKIAVQMIPSSTPLNDAKVWLAVTESGLHTNVLRGENAGEDLHHAAVVRTLQSVDAAGQSAKPDFRGELAVNLNTAWKRENLRFVAFVQDKKTLRVLGAASVHPQ